MPDFYFWSVVLFFSILGIMIYRDRKNLEFHKIMVIKRSKKGRKLIQNVASSSPRFWNAVSLIFVIAAFVFMIYGTYLLSTSTYLVLNGMITKPAIQFILPIPQSQPINGTGFIGVPFWFLILTVPFVMFPHEFAHGVIANVNKIKIKNVGLMQVLIFSGAFVEPDERDLKKAKLLPKLKVFSSGSMTNLTIAILLLLASRYLLWPAAVPTGVLVTDVIKNSGAELAGLEPGMLIQEIDGKVLKVDYDEFTLSYTYLLMSGNITSENINSVSTMVSVGEILENYEPGQTMEIIADNEYYYVKLSGRPENSTIPYIGISGDGIRTNDFMSEFLFPFTWWLTTLSYFVAVFNLLPIYPLDGGLMIEAVAEKYTGKHAKRLTSAVTILTIFMIIFNFIGPSIISMII